MDTIDNMVKERLDNYFADYPDTTDMHELREELTADLSEAAHEREAQGESMTDAVNHAFEQLGDLDDLVDEINQTNPEDDATFTDDDTTTHKHEGHYHHHGHHIDITDNQISIDGGKLFKADENGLTVNGGKTINIDENGLDINNGQVSFTSDGVRLGNLVIDDTGFHREDVPSQKATSPKKTTTDDTTFANFDKSFDRTDATDTEIYVDRLSMVNEVTFSPETIDRINFDYVNSSVRVLPNHTTDTIILREYMSRANTSYFAHTDVNNGTLTIKSGKRPHLLPLRIRTQLLIPMSFTGDLLLNVRSGVAKLTDLTMLNQVRTVINSGTLQVDGGHMKDLDIENSSGNVKLRHLTVDGLLRSRVHSGSTRLDDVKAKTFDLVANSGIVRGTALAGAGSIQAKSGTINLDFSGLTGNLDTSATSGTIKLHFAPGTEYNFDLDAESGAVSGPRTAIYDHKTSAFKDGAVGEDPEFYVTAVAKSGTIRLS
ncbi:DUF4097 family beta strand repeat-containing protein [Furfurilactobacillus entadae]|uniref:DUF4097 family beta strand repeat-containing protein n=1 Tax=Furfurilactobacillus entadae TaxID=2922307 RepID=UPI0038B365A9